MKIFEFQPGIGTLSAGFEAYGDYEVVQVQKISSQEVYTYNLMHKNRFRADKSDFINQKRLKNHDLAILRPNFGILMTQNRAKKAKLDELWSCLAYIEKTEPKIAIILTPAIVIKHLNIGFKYVTDGFNMVSKDIIIESMQKSGYMVWQVVIDQLQCGVPQYYPVNFYIGVRSDQGDIDDMQLPTIQYGARKERIPFHTIKDALSDLPTQQNPSKTYNIEPQNSLQAWYRQHTESELTHNEFHTVKTDVLPYIQDMKQGASINKNTNIKGGKGKRAIWNQPAILSHNFHKIKSTGTSIHPYDQRPFTIREGARLHGIQDHIHFRSDTSIPIQAQMIHESISPLTSVYLIEMLKPYTQ